MFQCGSCGYPLDCNGYCWSCHRTNQDKTIFEYMLWIGGFILVVGIASC